MADPLRIDELSPELQQSFRLEGIFMPEARRQRDKLYKNNPEPKFVHYTTADAAFNIIKEKRIWLRNTTAMADYLEVQHGFQILYNFFHNDLKKNAFVNAFDACRPGAAIEAIGLFDQWWTNTERGIRTRTYVMSVSEHHQSEDQHGRLSMWRAFGANTPARVALVFKVPPLSGAMDALKCMFSPVAYLNEERTHEIIDEVIANARREAEFISLLPHSELVKWIFGTLVAGVTCLKHEGFIEEKEWRVIYLPGQNPSHLIEEEGRVIGGVPQVIHKLPIDKRVSDELSDIDLVAMFDSLIIGPASQPWVMYEAFTRVLKDAGIPEAIAKSRVLTSGIPLRSL